MIFHLFAHNVPVEERSRAFGYLVAAGSVGQVVASVVGSSVAFNRYYVQHRIIFYGACMYFSFTDMFVLGVGDWILFIWINRYFMDVAVAAFISGNEFSGRDTLICS